MWTQNISTYFIHMKVNKKVRTIQVLPNMKRNGSVSFSTLYCTT